MGSAKLIAEWSGETLTDGLGTLSSGDKVEITTRQVGVFVSIYHKKMVKQIVATGGEEFVLSTVVKVYEYDFDKDGQQEIVVIHSPEYSIATVEVFRYQSGMVERVGKFNGQFDIVIDANTITLPYGSVGLGDTFIYLNGAFFGLVYHDPEGK
jgi:predicted small secreted protein